MPECLFPGLGRPPPVAFPAASFDAEIDAADAGFSRPSSSSRRRSISSPISIWSASSITLSASDDDFPATIDDFPATMDDFPATNDNFLAPNYRRRMTTDNRNRYREDSRKNFTRLRRMCAKFAAKFSVIDLMAIQNAVNHRRAKFRNPRKHFL